MVGALYTAGILLLAAACPSIEGALVVCGLGCLAATFLVMAMKDGW